MFSISPGSDGQLFFKKKVPTNPKYTTRSLPNSTGYLAKEAVVPNYISSKMAAVKQVCCMNSCLPCFHEAKCFVACLQHFPAASNHVQTVINMHMRRCARCDGVERMKNKSRWVLKCVYTYLSHRLDH